VSYQSKPARSTTSQNGADAELKAVEVEFATAEDELENLRDNLRILQAMPA
jgi:hypothetical protein